MIKLLLLSVSIWPFITIRQTRDAVRAPEKFREIIAASARHPGSADEYWLSFPAGLALTNAQAKLELWKPFLTLLGAAHITAGFQQGVTLGHNAVDAEAGVFSDDAWQVDRKGVRQRLLCPRSPEVLAYEADFVERAVRTLNLRSFWLDDDLRMGGGKAEGCFCDRCLAAFNREYGLNLTREELVARLDSQEPKEDLRRKWRLFKNRSLAVYGAAVRQGADRADPTVRLGYQSVDALFLTAGESYLPLLEALAGTNGVRSAIRVGSGNYFESLAENYKKSFSVMREAERCRRADFVAQISYEQETHTREVLHKSAEAALIESAMALAAGADALTEYWWTAARDEPTAYFEEFSAMIAEWRPYLEALGEVSRATSLAGLARFRGSDHLTLRSDYLGDADDISFGSMGVPMTVDELPQAVWYVNRRSLDEWGSGDAERLAAKGAVVDKGVWDRLLACGGEPVARAVRAGRIVPFDFKLARRRNRTLPTHAERLAFLDAVEKVARLPVRIERAHPLYVYPRVDAEGRVRAVSIFNGSVGRCLPTEVVVRRPAGGTVRWLRPGERPRPLAVTRRGEDLVVTIPGIPGANAGTLVLQEGGAAPADFTCSDPFIVRDDAAGVYRLYHNVGVKSADDPLVVMHTSKDLVDWSEPQGVLYLPKSLNCDSLWAPEVHPWKGKWYLFGTIHRPVDPKNLLPVLVPDFKPQRRKSYLATWTFVADSPAGPFKPFADRAITPEDWSSLDGTLFEQDGRPYMVFCHEWTQLRNGSMEAVEMAPDLSKAVGKPFTLFRASDLREAVEGHPMKEPRGVTDGPFLYRTKTGRLLMLWSSAFKGYLQAVSRSESGRLEGPWTHHEVIRYEDSGHGMAFKTFDGRLAIALHSPNTPHSAKRLRIFELEDTGDTLKVGRQIGGVLVK